MIQNCSKLKVYDNSGVNIVKCFKNLTYKNNKKLNLIIKISIQELKIHKKLLVKKGQIKDALIIKSKSGFIRFNGQKILFNTNGCILIDPINFKNKKTRSKIIFIGSTIFGIVAKEIRLYSVKININSIKVL